MDDMSDPAVGQMAAMLKMIRRSELKARSSFAKMYSACVRTVARPAAGISLALCLVIVLSSVLSAANAQGLRLVRDTEIESLLNDYAQPIFRAAGLGRGRVAMRIVNDNGFNAFVVDGRNVFINTGTLVTARTPNEVIGVIAHEAGHIAGGHLAALRHRIKKDQTRSLLAQILGIGLIVAGGATGGDAGRDLGSAGTGVLYGGNDIIMRSLLAERRSQEAAADQAGLAYLNRTKQSGRGMLETFERFAQQEYISDTHKEAFVRSHPVAADRLARLRERVMSSPYYGAKDSEQLQLRHNLMRAKIRGFCTPSIDVQNYYGRKQTLPAKYARAIAANCDSTCNGVCLKATPNSIKLIDELIQVSKRSNPYFLELKARVLRQTGKPSAAVSLLDEAIRLTGRRPTPMEMEQVRALQKVGSKAALARAAKILRNIVNNRERDNVGAHNLLGVIYYAQGKQALSYLSRAQALRYAGNGPEAKSFAMRAKAGLKSGTPAWRVATDIIEENAKR